MTAPVGLQHRIPSLDGLRAVAVLCVIWGHFAKDYESPLWGLERFLPLGAFGVQVFFVLSGFLITQLLLREREKTGRISFRAFYRRRAYRILPAFYVFLAVVGVLWAIGAIVLTLPVFLSAAFFVRDYVPTGGSWWLGHTWSLSIEEQFYLLWPLLLVRLNPRWLLRLLVVGVVASPFIRGLTYVFIPQLRSGIEIMFHTRADALMIGCLLALLWNNARFQAAAATALRRGLGWGALIWMVVSWWATQEFDDAWEFSVGYLGDALAIAVILTWVVRRPETIGGRLLNNRIVRHIGVLSYSLYLWQQLFLTTMNTTFLGHAPWNLLATLVAAELSYWLVEKTFLRLRQLREAPASPQEGVSPEAQASVKRR